MTGMDQTTVEALRDLAQEASGPTTLELGEYHVVVAGGGLHKIDLTGDQWREYPRRKAGVVTVRNVASFAHYYGKHSSTDSEVFADLDAATVTAVLDAHASGTEGANWQEHRLQLALQTTLAWRAWMSKNGQLMRQADFANFLEDHAGDVAADGPVSATDLLEIAQKFQAHTKVEFASGTRLHSGETQFSYIESTSASSQSRGGTIEIPTEFHLGISPYEDCDAYRIVARFRYRISQNDGLLLGFALEEPERRARAAVEEIAEKVADECGITLMHGSPS